jgi:hypothetical protein
LRRMVRVQKSLQGKWEKVLAKDKNYTGGPTESGPQIYSGTTLGQDTASERWYGCLGDHLAPGCILAVLGRIGTGVGGPDGEHWRLTEQVSRAQRHLEF